jgi:GNAT superfamily N-acetyltransferase
MPTVTVERTYLEQREPPADADAPALPHGVHIQEEGDCTVGTFRELYTTVGRDFHWRDRLAWTDEQLAEYLRSPDVRIWIMREVDQLAGYFELCRHSDGSVEIAYFGLYPSHHGRGLGRALLTTAVAEGWGWGANRLWVHTCTLDGPAALPNYLARGFVPFNHERYDAVLPDE